jgi:hypothetical protein
VNGQAQDLTCGTFRLGLVLLIAKFLVKRLFVNGDGVVHPRAHAALAQS